MLKCSFWAGQPRPYIAVLTTRVIRNPRDTNKTPSPFGYSLYKQRESLGNRMHCARLHKLSALTTRVIRNPRDQIKLPPGFAVLQLLLFTNSLPASPYSLFEKRESPGDRLRWRSSQQRVSLYPLLYIIGNHINTAASQRACDTIRAARRSGKRR